MPAAVTTAPPSRHTLEDHVIVGHVLGAWGVQGDVKVRPATDIPDRFAPGNTVHLHGTQSRIERVRPSKDTLIVKLDVVEDRTAAQAVRGQLLTVPQESLVTLPSGSYYHFHIIDMEAYTEDGRRLGTVRRILPAGDTDVYEIAAVDGGEALVPATEECVLEVDVPANRMTVRLSEMET